MLFAKADNEFKFMFNTVKCFSDKRKIDFGLDRCANVIFKKRCIIDKQSVNLDYFTNIRELDQEEDYRYLVRSEGDGIQHNPMKEK